MNQVTGGIWVLSASSEKKGKCGWPDGEETAFHAAGKEIERSDTLASSKATPTNDEQRSRTPLSYAPPFKRDGNGGRRRCMRSPWIRVVFEC